MKVVRFIGGIAVVLTILVCATSLGIAFGYYDLKHRELDVQIEITRALSRYNNTVKPSLDVRPGDKL